MTILAIYFAEILETSDKNLLIDIKKSILELPKRLKKP